MKQLPGKYFLAGLVLASVICAPVAAQSGSQAVFGDAKFWREFDWTHATATDLWRLPEWGDVKASDELKFAETRVQPIAIQGQDMEVRSIVDRSKPATPTYRFQVFSNANGKACATTRDWANANFGKGVDKDTSYSLALGQQSASELKLVHEVHEWLLGTTSVQLLCLGTEDTGQKEQSSGVFVALTFRSLDTSSRILPLTSISCVGADERASDVVLVLDETDPTVMRYDLSPIASGDDVFFSPTTVTWDVSAGDSGKIKYELSRVTGRMVARLGARSSDVKLQWACEKIGLGERKF